MCDHTNLDLRYDPGGGTQGRLEVQMVIRCTMYVPQHLAVPER